MFDIFLEWNVDNIHKNVLIINGIVIQILVFHFKLKHNLCSASYSIYFLILVTLLVTLMTFVLIVLMIHFLGRPPKAKSTCTMCNESKHPLNYVLPTQNGKKEFCSVNCLAEFRKEYVKVIYILFVHFFVFSIFNLQLA